MSKSVIHTGMDVQAQNMAIGIAEAGAEVRLHAPNPCRDPPPERPWCPQRGLLLGKPSPAGPGRRHQSVLTGEKWPEAFPSEGPAVRRN